MGKQQTISLKQRRRTSSNKPLHKTTHVKPRLAATESATAPPTPAKTQELWEGACRKKPATSRPLPARRAPASPGAALARARLADRARDRLGRLFARERPRAHGAPLLAFERWQLATGEGAPRSSSGAPADALAAELSRAGLDGGAARRVVREAAAGNRDDAGAPREGTVRVTSHRHTADVELVGAGGRRVGRLLKANHGHVAKLRAMHDAFGGDAPFEEDLFRVLCRYAGAAGHGFHAALPSRAFACLRDDGGVTLECFASPLNCYFAPFCSASLVDDAPFGSIGSFFDFHPTGGSYEVNPPFVDDVLARAADHARELLAAATKPLSFVFVVPGWTDSDAWARLSGSPFLRDGPLLVAADDHGYVDGAQHSRRDRHRASPYDTAFFFLQNDAGYAAWPPKRTKPALRRAMASGKPTDAEARRRASAGRGQAPEDGSGAVYKGKKKNRRAAPGAAADHGARVPKKPAKQAKKAAKRAEKRARKREAARETAEAHAPSRESIPGVVSFM